MTIQIKLSKTSSIKVKTQIAIPESLSGVDNVDVSNVQDGYILMYNEELGRYAFVDPDDVLIKSTITNEGLPQDFLNTLDVDLDNRIDLDGGEF
jgi:hypothetical protein